MSSLTGICALSRLLRKLQSQPLLFSHVPPFPTISEFYAFVLSNLFLFVFQFYKMTSVMASAGL